MPKMSPLRARERFGMLKPLYSQFQRQVVENRRYYDLDFASDAIHPSAQARGFKPVIPRTARRSIDEATDHVLPFPKVEVPVRDTESDYVTQRDIAEKKRKAVNAWWRQISQRFNTIGDARKSLFLDGMVAVKQTIRWDLLPDKPKTHTGPEWDAYKKQLDNLGKYEFLWDLEILDSLWVYPDPSNPENPEYVYVAYSIRVEDALRIWPKANGNWKKRDPYERIDFIEYWSHPRWSPDGKYEPGDHYVWLEAELVHKADNPYPYIPIAIVASGYGVAHSSADPHDRFVGLNEHSHSVFVAQARQWSAMEAVAELTAFSPLVTRNMDDDAIQRLSLSLGAVWPLEGNEGEPDAQSVEFMPMPVIPATVPQMLSLTDREANGALKLDVLGGMPQRGVDTATEADQNVRNSSAKLQAPVAALERLAAKLSRWFFMDIQLVLESPVTLYGSSSDDEADIKLTPGDISGYYDVKVKLTTTDEEALQLTKARFWLDAYQLSPFLSALTVLEAGGIVDDGLREMIRRQAEDVFLSEEYRLARQLEGADAMGQLQDMARALLQGGTGGGQNGLNSDQRLLEQEDINSPLQARTVQNAYNNRDVNQGGAFGRA